MQELSAHVSPGGPSLAEAVNHTSSAVHSSKRRRTRSVNDQSPQTSQASCGLKNHLQVRARPAVRHVQNSVNDAGLKKMHQRIPKVVTNSTPSSTNPDQDVTDNDHLETISDVADEIDHESHSEASHVSDVVDGRNSEEMNGVEFSLSAELSDVPSEMRTHDDVI